MTVLDAQSDDPEERRRLIEARDSAENLGAMIGLAAGLAIAAHRSVVGTQEQPEAPKPLIEQETPDWSGPAMRQTMR